VWRKGSKLVACCLLHRAGFRLRNSSIQWESESAIICKVKTQFSYYLVYFIQNLAFYCPAILQNNQVLVDRDSDDTNIQILLIQFPHLIWLCLSNKYNFSKNKVFWSRWLNKKVINWNFMGFDTLCHIRGQLENWVIKCNIKNKHHKIQTLVTQK